MYAKIVIYTFCSLLLISRSWKCI